MEVTWEEFVIRFGEIIELGIMERPLDVGMFGKLTQESSMKNSLAAERVPIWFQGEFQVYREKLLAFAAVSQDKYYMIQDDDDNVILAFKCGAYISFWVLHETEAKNHFSITKDTFLPITNVDQVRFLCFPCYWKSNIEFPMDSDEDCEVLVCTPKTFLSAIPFSEFEDAFKIKNRHETVEYLRPSDAPTVAKHWKYGTGPDYPENRILQAPSACIRDTEGNIISWALTHYDLSLGFVFTLPEYRKKGYAKRCVEILVLRMFSFMQSNRVMPLVYCHIVDTNESSLNLFSSFGFNTLPTKIFWADV